MGNTILDIDISDVQDLVDGLKQVFDDRTFQQLMFRVMKRAGTRTKMLVRQYVPVDYQAKGGWVAGALGDPRVTTNGSGAGCTIPINSARGKIGAGGQFKAGAMGASGGRVTSAFEGRKGKRTARAYKINAQIVKSGSSALPSSGGRPHIMLMGKAGNRGGVYVLRKDLGMYMATVHRRTKTKGVRTYKAKKHRISAAVGIGVPQMPMTRSADKIQTGVLKVLVERIEHEYEAVLRQYVGGHMR